MINLAGLPEPPARDGWWDLGSLVRHIKHSLEFLRHEALEMKGRGGTKADWIYLADLRRALALRAWDEIEKGE